MARSLRHLAVHLALVAMVLRALLPTGWMPNLDGHPGGPLLICAMDGGSALFTDHAGLPSKHQPDGRAGHDGCPFAAAPHLATAGISTVIQQLHLAQNLVAGFAENKTAPQFSGYAPQSPRAPPHFI
jgi:hypothetical protein